ncbi:MAG: DUF3987 domain-containing protein, partial [Planctomycetes bacterium]|nr:DUF3987 domain-containing protein [Planctomycetota bacterium]
KPGMRQIYVDDATIESLTDAFEGNPRGVLWYRDELAGLFQDMDKYSGGGNGGGTKSRLMTAYDSGPWKRNRIGSGCLNIRHACLSIFGTVQEGILPQLFTSLDAATGFLPRFLFVRAEPTGPAFWTDKVFDAKNRLLIREITERALEMELDPGDTPLLILIDPKAMQEYIRWHDFQAAEPWTDFDGQVFEALAAKLRGQCLRLCLILHVLESIANDQSELEPVSVKTMLKAITTSCDRIMPRSPCMASTGCST